MGKVKDRHEEIRDFIKSEMKHIRAVCQIQGVKIATTETHTFAEGRKWVVVLEEPE